MSMNIFSEMRPCRIQYSARTPSPLSAAGGRRTAAPATRPPRRTAPAAPSAAARSGPPASGTPAGPELVSRRVSVVTIVERQQI